MTSSEYIKKKYFVYQNDLKYKKYRNLNPNYIIWQNDLKYLYDNVNFDSLEYRLHECEKNGMNYLDLNNMDMIKFPNIPKEFKDKIKYLFIAENDLSILPDLTDFKQLEILDISNNNIEEIDELPHTLKELSCRQNKLCYLPNKLPYIERIDCTFNKIIEINSNYPNLKNLVCAYNSINIIPNLENLEDLICCHNVINYIYGCKKLKYLDCSYNKIIKLDKYDNLIDLICNNNGISDIICYNNLKYIELFNTNIQSIPFMENLIDMYCDKNLVKRISKKYIDTRNIDIKIYKDTIIHILFLKK